MRPQGRDRSNRSDAEDRTSLCRPLTLRRQPAADKTRVDRRVEAFKGEVAKAYGNGSRFERVLVSADFLVAAEGFRDGRPIHYPRITHGPSIKSENFKWFQQSEIRAETTRRVVKKRRWPRWRSTRACRSTSNGKIGVLEGNAFGGRKMKTQASERPGMARKGRKPAAKAAKAGIVTCSGGLAGKDGRPVLSWEASGRRQTAVLDAAHISPALRQPVAGEIPVSFEIAEDTPIHVRRAGEKWRVLVSVLGGTPAVITETLQELYRRSFVPDEIVIFTTTVGERGLDESFDANLRALSAEYGAAVPDYRPVELLCDADGSPLSDIRSDSDNIAAANIIANRVRELTRYTESVIHASVAGGRKTMGTLLSDAMSLFGRGSDAVSHVLVQPEAAERAANFYYRPKVPFELRDRGDKPITDRAGRALTSADVRLDLANKPFFRLRGVVDEPLLADTRAPIDFAEVTKAVNVTVNRPKLILHDTGAEIEIVDYKQFSLDPTHYALYRVVAEATAGTLRGVRGDGFLTPDDFVRAAAVLPGRPANDTALHSSLPAAAVRYIEILRHLLFPGWNWAEFIASEFWKQGTGTGAAIWRCIGYEEAIDYINPVISRANDALAERLGFRSVARLYQIDSTGRKPKRFRLACDRSLIEIRN